MSAPQSGSGASGHQTAHPTAANIAYPNWKFLAIMLIVSQGISLLGSEVVQYAMVWHITLSTKSGTAVAFAVIFGFLPRLVLSPPGGSVGGSLQPARIGGGGGLGCCPHNRRYYGRLFNWPRVAPAYLFGFSVALSR